MALSDILPGVLREEVGADLAAVTTWWLSNLPPRYREVSCPNALKQGTLWVTVTHEIWRLELEFARDDLTRTLQKQMPHLHIQQMRFIVEQGPRTRGRHPRDVAPER